jgi:MFS family permease
MNTTFVNPRQRANYHHLYADVTWFGLLAGSTLAFLAIYATRLGASAFQISLLTAGPAMMNLFFSLPAGRMLENRPIIHATYRSALYFRVGYLILVFLPLALSPFIEIWAVIVLNLFMSVPGTLLAIAFNAMFADVVHPEHRSEVVGRRNALMSLSLLATTLVSGQILVLFDMPYNYQIVFAIGAVGGLMSTYHLGKLRPETQPYERVGKPIGDFGRGGVMRMIDAVRLSVGLRFLTRAQGAKLLRLDLLRGPYGLFLAAYLIFYAAQNMPIPLFPVAFVRVLELRDSSISLGTAMFHGAVLFTSLRLARLSGRYTQKQMLVAGAFAYALYPLLIGLARSAALYWVASILGGLVWGLAGAALVNRLMEQTAEDDRAAYMALHNLVLNLGILAGALLGPLLGEWVGVTQALLIVSGLRIVSGVLLWRWA